jgi:nucleoside-diphosphate-sugar epimerase
MRVIMGSDLAGGGRRHDHAGDGRGFDRDGVRALARGEAVVFVDPEPRADFLRMKLGTGTYTTSFEEVPGAVRALCPTLRYEIEADERPHAQPARLDISRAKQHLGWEPRVTIVSAFADYLAELTQARGTKRPD